MAFPLLNITQTKLHLPYLPSSSDKILKFNRAVPPHEILPFLRWGFYFSFGHHSQ